MKKFLQQNQFAYLILFLLLALFVIMFLQSWPNRLLQRTIAIGFGATYFIWGVITHTKSKRITMEVVFEYLGVAALATLLIILITL